MSEELKKKMKILFLIPNLGHGGAEKVLVNLVNHLDREQFQITVMVLYDEGVNRASLAPYIEYKACFKRSFTGVSHLFKAFSPKQLFMMILILWFLILKGRQRELSVDVMMQQQKKFVGYIEP